MSNGVFRSGLRPGAKLARSIAGSNGLFEKMGILAKLHRHNPLNCPICTRSGPFWKVATRTLRNGKRTPLFECSHCTHKFIHPMPSTGELLSWYQGIEYRIADCAYQGLHPLELNEQWAGFISARMTPLEQDVLERFGLSGSLRIGEFGCSEGALLKHLATKGHSVVGFEVDTETAVTCAKKYGIEIVSGAFELADARGRDLDVIMSFHTLEHVREPVSVVAHAAEMLRQGGCIIMEVPFKDWESDNLDHLHFFTEQSLTHVLKNQFSDLILRANTYLYGGVRAADSMFVSGRKR